MAQVKPDLIIAWPIWLDLPGFRIQFKKYSHLFNKIIILWCNGNCHMELAAKIVPFIEKEMAIYNVEYVTYQESDKEKFQDWAARMYSAGYKRVVSEYLLMTQQDFIIHNPVLYETVFTDKYKLVSRHEGDGIQTGFRCEPDFIYFHMPTFRKTSMNVSIGPHPVTGLALDHCGPLSYELRNLCPDEKSLEELGFVSPRDWEHLRGFTQSYGQLMANQSENILHCRSRFIQYNQDLLNIIQEVKVLPETMSLIEAAARLIP